MKAKIFAYALSAMLFALCGSVDAQQPAKIPRIGYLSSVSASAAHSAQNQSAEACESLGMEREKHCHRAAIRGGNIRSPACAGGRAGRHHYHDWSGANRAATRATVTIPIVMPEVGDPVGSG